MNMVYRVAGISKQGFHQRLDRVLDKLGLRAQLLPLLVQVRKDHPEMSARSIFHLLRPKGIGREQFIQWAYDEGFKLLKKKRLRLTTDSTGTQRFPNRIAGQEFTCVNQAWVSDITYYPIADRTYYLTLIMDLYSRKVVGYHASASLRTEQTTLPALKQAIGERGTDAVKGLIFHSDGGGQYYSKSFVGLTSQHQIQNSMSYQVLENAHAERLMGIIKNNYVRHYRPRSLTELTASLSRAVRMYNQQKPHGSLGNKNPDQFEKELHQQTPSTMWITPRYIPTPVTHISTKMVARK